MKRVIAIIMILFIAVNLTGCDALQRKFTRKKKAVKPVPKLYQLKRYDIKPSIELYNKHYAYWSSWMLELLQDLGQNRKRDERCITEAISQARDMQNLLIPEKAEALEKYICWLEEARDVIVREELSQYNRSWVLTTIERADRIVKGEFSPGRMKDCIRPSFDSKAAAEK